MSDSPFPRGSAGDIAWRQSFGEPAAGAPSPVAARQALVAAHPELDDQAISRLQARIASEAVRADVAAQAAEIDSQWQAERAASQAAADALYERITSRPPETEADVQARRAEAIRRENNL